VLSWPGFLAFKQTIGWVPQYLLVNNGKRMPPRAIYLPYSDPNPTPPHLRRYDRFSSAEVRKRTSKTNKRRDRAKLSKTAGKGQVNKACGLNKADGHSGVLWYGILAGLFGGQARVTTGSLTGNKRNGVVLLQVWIPFGYCARANWVRRVKWDGGSL
jgi:hypothetical protein